MWIDCHDQLIHSVAAAGHVWYYAIYRTRSNEIFIDADLSGAFVISADLSGSNLKNANLFGTDMRSSKLQNTMGFEI